MARISLRYGIRYEYIHLRFHYNVGTSNANIWKANNMCAPFPSHRQLNTPKIECQTPNAHRNESKKWYTRTAQSRNKIATILLTLLLLFVAFTPLLLQLYSHKIEKKTPFLLHSLLVLLLLLLFVTRNSFR